MMVSLSHFPLNAKNFHIYEQFDAWVCSGLFCGGGICFIHLLECWLSPSKTWEEADSITDHLHVTVTGHVLFLQHLTIAFLSLEVALIAEDGRECILPSS